MLIIKYKRLKSFLRKAEENGFTLICMLKTEMRQHSMKSSIIAMVTKAGRWTLCCSPATSLWGHSTDPAAPVGIRALFSFFASHKQVLYLSERPQQFKGLWLPVYTLKTIEGHTSALSHTNFAWWLLAIMNISAFFYTCYKTLWIFHIARRDREISRWNTLRLLVRDLTEHTRMAPDMLLIGRELGSLHRSLSEPLVAGYLQWKHFLLGFASAFDPPLAIGAIKYVREGKKAF